MKKYHRNLEQLESKFGLPSEVKFCKKCTISNQRPNSAQEYAHTRDTKKDTINFDVNGICDACNHHSNKKKAPSIGKIETEN